ncbi:MAG: hypothetical protein ABEI99_10430 [Halobaculum sp.]
MGKREYGFDFDEETVFSIVRSDAPKPAEQSLKREFFVFVMGPYTAFDANYSYPDAEELDSRFIDDPLFDPDEHRRDDGRATYESALADLCATLREEYGVRAFLATDIDIPTNDEAAEGEPSMSVLDQSIAFAAVSDAVVFVFTQGGLTTGTGSEVGSILSEFHLRTGNPEPIRKPRERFRIFTAEEFSSASIDEIPSTFEVDSLDFGNKSDLVQKIEDFLANIERTDPDRNLPVFKPYVPKS